MHIQALRFVEPAMGSSHKALTIRAAAYHGAAIWVVAGSGHSVHQALPMGESVLVVIDYYIRYYETSTMRATAGERK